MKLKRHFLKPDGWVKEVDAQGLCTNPPPLSHIAVQHTGSTPDQHFSDKLVAAGLSEGWLSIADGVLTLHAQPEDLHYRILRVPGKYPVAGDPVRSEVIHYYDCVLDEAAHAKYRVQKGAV